MESAVFSKDSRRGPDALDEAMRLALFRLRKRHGWTQQRCAAILGVTYQQYQKFETGRNRLKAAYLLRLMQAYGVGSEQLLRMMQEEAEVIGALHEAMRNGSGEDEEVRALRKQVVDRVMRLDDVRLLRSLGRLLTEVLAVSHPGSVPREAPGSSPG